MFPSLASTYLPRLPTLMVVIPKFPGHGFVLGSLLSRHLYQNSSLTMDLPACQCSPPPRGHVGYLPCIMSAFSTPFLPPSLLPYCPAGLSPHYPAFLHTFLLSASLPHPPSSQCAFMPASCPCPIPPVFALGSLPAPCVVLE